MTGRRRPAATIRETHVAQEGLPSLRRLLVQRTRWAQGTMQCIRYAPRIWRSPHVSTAGAAEILYYLVQPWLQLLGSLAYPVPWLLLAGQTARQPGLVAGWFVHGPGWVLFVVYGAFGLLPLAVWGPAYRRACEPGTTRRQAAGLDLAYAAYVYLFYVTSWRAAARIVTGRGAWVKTERAEQFAGTPG